MQEGGRLGGAAVRGFRGLAEGTPSLPPAQSQVFAHILDSSLSTHTHSQQIPLPLLYLQNIATSQRRSLPCPARFHRLMVSTCLLSWSPGSLRGPVLHSHPAVRMLQ